MRRGRNERLGKWCGEATPVRGAVRHHIWSKAQMIRRKEVTDISQPSMQTPLTSRSLLLMSSGAMWKCKKQSIMTKLKKRIVKWGLSVAKVGLAVSVLIGSAGQANQSEGCGGFGFGTIVQHGPE